MPPTDLEQRDAALRISENLSELVKQLTKENNALLAETNRMWAQIEELTGENERLYKELGELQAHQKKVTTNLIQCAHRLIEGAELLSGNGVCPMCYRRDWHEDDCPIKAMRVAINGAALLSVDTNNT